MSNDSRNNPVSYTATEAVQRLDRAIDKFHAYQADPLADVDAVIAEHPDFVMAHAFRAGMLTTSSDRAFEPELKKSVGAAEALSAHANERERGHIAAARAWLDGDFAGATEKWGRIAIDYPRDLLAVQLAHLGDFCHGYSHMLRDRIARVMPKWSHDVPGYGFLLGMYAFGLEESGDYARAEAVGRESAALNAQDGWGVHAVVHVMEMQGRTSDGIGFLRETESGWAPGSLFAFHNWWHLALYHLDSGEAATSVKLYDENISAGGFGQALELVDGSALLWRLMLLGHDVGARWVSLADKWQSRIDDAYYAFNDVHAMMAFVGTNRPDAQARVVAALERAAHGAGTNAMMARDVGLPMAKGLAAFGRGDYAQAVEHLMPLRAVANRFGGSHAQRDIVSWTLVEAALRLGSRSLAEALIAERLAQKPRSPINQAWFSRVSRMKTRQAA